MSSKLLQSLLAHLRTSRPQAKTDLERSTIDGASAVLVDGIFASGDMLGVPSPPSSEPELTQQVAERPMSQHSPFFGIGLKEACPKLLRLIGDKVGKVPQTPRDIWEQLKAEGWTSNHHDPVRSVNDALRRRAKTHRDVMIVGAGRWGRTDWYTEAELEEIKKSVGGMGGRDRGDHVERTKAGMATAKERGARLGAMKKLSDEQGTQILDLARAGLTKEKIAKQFGISTASVTNYVKSYGYNNLRELRAEGKKARAGATEPPEEGEPGETRH